MKTTYRNEIQRWLLMLAATFTVSMAATAQTLTVEPFEQVAGEEALIPVHLSANGTSIVGAQFDITLPYKKSSSSVVLAASLKHNIAAAFLVG